MTRKELVQLLIKYGNLMGQKNFTPGTSGNMSFRYGANVLITASNTSNAFLKEEDVVLIDYEGNSLEKNSKKPSSEKLMHLEIYKKRPDLNVILHVHSPYLCSFASSNESLNKPVMAEIAYYFGSIPTAEYALPSSKELANNVAKYFDKNNAVLMANHGFVVGAKDIQDAYLKLELAESYAQVVYNTYALGGAKILSKEQEEEILKLRNS